MDNSSMPSSRAPTNDLMNLKLLTTSNNLPKHYKLSTKRTSFTEISSLKIYWLAKMINSNLLTLDGLTSPRERISGKLTVEH